MADEKTILTYKGRPLMRKDNLVYYGSMADSHIVMLQILVKNIPLQQINIVRNKITYFFNGIYPRIP